MTPSGHWREAAKMGQMDKTEFHLSLNCRNQSTIETKIASLALEVEAAICRVGGEQVALKRQISRLWAGNNRKPYLETRRTITASWAAHASKLEVATWSTTSTTCQNVTHGHQSFMQEFSILPPNEKSHLHSIHRKEHTTLQQSFSMLCAKNYSQWG